MFRSELVKELSLYIIKNGKRILIPADAFIDFTMYESLTEIFTSAHFTLKTNFAIAENLPIVGGEEVEVNLQTAIDDHPRITCKFEVVSMHDDMVSSPLNSEMKTIRVNLASKIFMPAIKNRYSRSFKDQTASEIISHISKNMLGSEIKSVEPTAGTLNFVMTYDTPIDSIVELLSRCSAARGDAGMMLFETPRDGLKLQSISTMLDTAPVIKLVPNATNIHYEGNVRAYKRVAAFSRQSAVVKRMHGSSAIGFDVRTKRIIAERYTYEDFLKKSMSTGEAGIMPKADCTTTHEQYCSFEDLDAFKWRVMNKIRHESVYQIAVQAVMVANTRIAAGDTVDFVYEAEDRNQVGSENPMLTGRYLVGAKTTIFDGTEVMQHLTLIRDAYTKSNDKSIPATANVVRR